MTFPATICDLCAEDDNKVMLATHRYDSLTRPGLHLCESHVRSLNAALANMRVHKSVRPVRDPEFNQLQPH